MDSGSTTTAEADREAGPGAGPEAGPGTGPGTGPGATAEAERRVEVQTRITMDVVEQATLALQVAVAGPPPADEVLTVTVDGEELPVTVIEGDVGGRQHLVSAPVGQLVVNYRASAALQVNSGTQVTPVERVVALRPSRYCPSDRVGGLATALLASGSSDAEARPSDEELLRLLRDHVASRLSYISGSSDGTTDAVETLLSGQGVCRDYAHTVAMLGRALGLPTRLAAVYAPGLSPMDMHAVVEVAVDGVWRVVDATGLAPRQTLVRIATGRDAADTAFLTVLDGQADMGDFEVSAVVEGDLPVDDHEGLLSLAMS